jgi:hypothetical protein
MVARPTSPILATADAILVDSASAVVDVVSTGIDEALEELDEKMVGYEPSPERAEVNVLYLSSDYYVVGDVSTIAQFNFATQSVVFQKPGDSISHLKPLHVKGHINGMPVHNIVGG